MSYNAFYVELRVATGRARGQPLPRIRSVELAKTGVSYTVDWLKTCRRSELQFARANRRVPENMSISLSQFLCSEVPKRPHVDFISHRFD